MKERLLTFLRGETRWLDLACVLYCFYLVWVGETGNPLLCGIAMLLPLLFVLSPEHLLPPLFCAVLLEQNCSVVGMTASRYLTIVFLAVSGLTMLIRNRRIERKGLLYTVLLLAYFTASTLFSRVGFGVMLVSMAMNILLMYFIAHLPTDKMERVVQLLLGACYAVILYFFKVLFFDDCAYVVNGRYWLLGEGTNPNRHGISLAQAALFCFGFACIYLFRKRWTWVLASLAGYVSALYLIILTGSRSATVGIVGAVVMAAFVLVIREKNKWPRLKKAGLTAALLALVLVMVGTLTPSPQVVAASSSPIGVRELHAVLKADEEHKEQESQPPAETPPEEPQPPAETPPEEPLPETWEEMDRINRWNFSDAARVGGFAGRFSIWNDLWTYVITPHPLFGVGFGVGNIIATLEDQGIEYIGAHNILFDLLAAIGIVGVLLLAIPLIWMLLRAANRLPRQVLVFIPAAMVLGALCAGVGEDTGTERFLWVAVGLCLWLLWAPSDKAPAAGEADAGRPDPENNSKTLPEVISAEE